jgi:hypothetical protein
MFQFSSKQFYSFGKLDNDAGYSFRLTFNIFSVKEKIL